MHIIYSSAEYNAIVFNIYCKWWTIHLISTLTVILLTIVYTQERHFLHASNYAFTVIFALEMMIKVICVSVYSINSVLFCLSVNMDENFKIKINNVKT